MKLTERKTTSGGSVKETYKTRNFDPTLPSRDLPTCIRKTDIVRSQCAQAVTAPGGAASKRTSGRVIPHDPLLAQRLIYDVLVVHIVGDRRRAIIAAEEDNCVLIGAGVLEGRDHVAHRRIHLGNIAPHGLFVLGEVCILEEVSVPAN